MNQNLTKRLQASVIAVPPLARTDSLTINAAENTRLIRYLERGGVSTLLYGGNALFYHIRLSEYANTLATLRQAAHADTWIIPSIGPTFGMMMDQAAIVADMPFESAMVLPQREIADESGIATGLRMAAERMGKPLVLYLKFDRWLSPATVERLYRDGLIQWIKYAVVRENAAEDAYLAELIDRVPKEIIVSGMGEQPAVTHVRDFGMAGFTSGCVCVHPWLSTRMLRAMQRNEWEIARECQRRLKPLEDLRDAISPIRVLHAAVQSSQIADLGPITPLLGPLEGPELDAVGRVSRSLRDAKEFTDAAMMPGTSVC